MNIVLVALIIAQAKPARTASSAFQPFEMVMEGSRSVDNQKITETSHIWVQSLSKYRFEQVTGTQKMVTIANGGNVWILNESTKVGAHSVEKPEVIAKIGKQAIMGPEMISEFIKKGGKKAGVEKIGGQSCIKYVRQEKTGMKYTLWVTADLKQVKRFSGHGITRAAIQFGQPIETHELSSVADIISIKPGVSMPESLFLPTPGVKFSERASSLPQAKK